MFHHITVLKEELVESLRIRPDGIYVDCTLGGAGHSGRIATELSPSGRLIAFDQDDWALEHAKVRLAAYKDRITLVKTNFRNLEEVLIQVKVPLVNDIPQVDGILFDLGVSSPQLDEGERGFSYNYDAPLDMRMDQNKELTAYNIVNEWPESDIVQLLFQYGEEKFSKRIAREIGIARAKQPIETTGELAQLVKAAIPAATRRTGGHPAKRTFQALRIVVNDELQALKDALHQAVRCLKPEGRIAVITFHSLEDRICKQFMNEYVGKCTCPPNFPVCVCERRTILSLVNRKPISPSKREFVHNPRSRSAKLRIAQKMGTREYG